MYNTAKLNNKILFILKIYNRLNRISKFPVKLVKLNLNQVKPIKETLILNKIELDQSKLLSKDHHILHSPRRNKRSNSYNSSNSINKHSHKINHLRANRNRISPMFRDKPAMSHLTCNLKINLNHSPNLNL